MVDLKAQDRDRDELSQVERSRSQFGKASPPEAVGGDSMRIQTTTAQERSSRKCRIEELAPERENQHLGLDRKRVYLAWTPSIFAAKTTVASLLALLIAFTFNLDEPQWTLLTVLIVSQPQQSGLVLAKSFYRIIGTLVGAAVALLLVALAAQERVLFLGALALWIGLCAFGSQYARNFPAYSFVLSGYTAAIVGIPGGLNASNAFYIATARVSEVCLGVIVAAAINRVILPSSHVATLWQSIAEARLALVDYVARILGDDDARASNATPVSKAIAIENQRASAIFEDSEVRDRSSSIRLANIALLKAVSAAQMLREQLAYVRHAGQPIKLGMDGACSSVTATLNLWRDGAIDAAGLRGRLREAGTRGALAPLLLPMLSTNNPTGQRAATGIKLRELVAALIAYAEAYEACVSGVPPVSGRILFSRANDPIDALWTGLRAALAVILVGTFWILSAWPHGSTAVILAAVATARLATMGHAVPFALVTALIFSLATLPAFVIIEMLLPLASGYLMFALIVGPFLFCCTFLMASTNPKTMLIGYMSGVLFAAVGQFQNHMAYDPVGLLNTSIAAVLAVGVTLVLWAVVAPETAEAARRRFLRIARQAVIRLTALQHPIGLAEFEMRIAEAFDQLQSHLRTDQSRDVADLDAASRLLGAGRALLGRRETDGAAPSIALDDAGIPDSYVAALLKCCRPNIFAKPKKQVGRNAA
jgi:uncharacterized membrane protein YccC